MKDDDLITFKGMKEKGLPYCRFHVCGRLIPSGKFPAFKKLVDVRGGRIVWRWGDVKHIFQDPPK